MRKILSIIVTVFLITACTTKQRYGGKNSNQNLPGMDSSVPEIPKDEAPVFAEKRYPQLGIVLGPGGARSQAYIGFLREIEKAQIPVKTISGIEWGALVAAIYAQNGKSNDAEWQLSKLDPGFFQKGILSSSTKDFKDLKGFLKTIFQSARIESGKVSFMCPATRSSDGYSGIFYRGLYVDTMSYCLPFYPLLRPSSSWFAAVLDLKAIHEYFKKEGVEYVILVDSILENPPQKSSQLSEESKVLWSLAYRAVKASESMYNKVIRLNVSADLNDFKSRKSQISIGEQAGKKFIEEYKESFGL